MEATNAVDGRIAGQLVDLVDEDSGTLLFATVHKVGVQRGPAEGRKTFGDDKVKVLIWTGFSHKALIQRSDKRLRALLSKGGIIKHLAAMTFKECPSVTVNDVCDAIQEVQHWFHRVLNGTSMHQERSNSPWEPLEIGGVEVKGCRVYNGMGGNSVVPGTIYVKGLKLGETIIEPAPNGSWKPKSQPKTIAKNILKDMLPVGRFCQYRLETERVLNLVVGEQAARQARDEGIPIDPEAIRQLFKVSV